MRLLKSQTREPSMNQIIRIGMDTSKHIFQLHGVDAAAEPVLRKRLRRKQVLAFFAKLPPTVIGMEACGASHYWAREVGRRGHEVRVPAFALGHAHIWCDGLTQVLARGFQNREFV